MTAAWDQFAADWPESAEIAQRQWDIARGLEQNEVLLLDEEHRCADGTPAVIGFVADTMVLAAVAGSAGEVAAGLQRGRLEYLRGEARAWAGRVKATSGTQPGTRLHDVRAILLGGRLEALRVDIAFADPDHLLTWSWNVGGFARLDR